MLIEKCMNLKKDNGRPGLSTESSGNLSNSSSQVIGEEETDQRNSYFNAGPNAGSASTAIPGFVKRAAVYARVSTQVQEREETIESQLGFIKDFLLSNDITIEDEDLYQDIGFSGSNLIRPSLDILRDKVAEGYYSHVFVLDPDRLARDFVMQMILLDEFKKAYYRPDWLT